jgi:hypothetical protein
MTHGCLPVPVCHDVIARNLRERVNASPSATALAKRRASMIIAACGSPHAGPRHMTPSLVLEVHGMASVIVHGHQSGAERTCRLDRIRECRLEASAQSLAGLCA